MSDNNFYKTLPENNDKMLSRNTVIPLSSNIMRVAGLSLRFCMTLFFGVNDIQLSRILHRALKTYINRYL